MMTARAQPTTRREAYGSDGGRGVGRAMGDAGGSRRLADAAPGGGSAGPGANGARRSACARPRLRRRPARAALRRARLCRRGDRRRHGRPRLSAPRGGRARPPTEPAPGRCRRAALRRPELRLCVVVERHLSRHLGRCRPPPRRDLAHPEARWALPGHDAVKARYAIRPRPAGRPRHLYPRQRRQGAPALLLRLGRPCRALRRLRAAVADPGGATPPWLLALAHPRRTAVNGGGAISATNAPPGGLGGRKSVTP